MVEYVPSNCVITRFRAAASVLSDLATPALLNYCTGVDVHSVVLLGK